MRHVIGFLVAASVTAGVSAAAAQSLGDLAKKEEARRQSAKPGKVYTNDSVRGTGSDTPTTSAPAAPAAPAATAPSPSGGPAEPPAAEKAPDPKHDEAYWRKRVADARERLERSKTFLEALQSRVNALSTDFVNRDDPAQRNVVARDRQKALAELDRVKRDIADAQKELQAIEDEGRKAGVPPGWLR